jgi:hypothetical protein
LVHMLLVHQRPLWLEERLRCSCMLQSLPLLFISSLSLPVFTRAELFCFVPFGYCNLFIIVCVASFRIQSCFCSADWNPIWLLISCGMVRWFWRTLETLNLKKIFYLHIKDQANCLWVFLTVVYSPFKAEENIRLVTAVYRFLYLLWHGAVVLKFETLYWKIFYWQIKVGSATLSLIVSHCNLLTVHSERKYQAYCSIDFFLF